VENGEVKETISGGQRGVTYVGRWGEVLVSCGRARKVKFWKLGVKGAEGRIVT